MLPERAAAAGSRRRAAERSTARRAAVGCRTIPTSSSWPPGAALAQCRDRRHRDRRRPGRDDRGQVYQPELLPEALRPKPRTQVVEVKTPAPRRAPSAQYVALLQKDGGSPAFILTVDGATKNFTVRKVGADAEPGKSFELWLISDKLPQPRSLGVIGGSDFTARPVLAAYDADTINPRPMR